MPANLEYKRHAPQHRSSVRAGFALSALIATALLTPGCQPSADWLKPPWASSSDSATSKTDSAAKSKTAKSDKSSDHAKSKTSDPASPEAFSMLADEGWIQSVSTPDDKQPPPHRWRHRALDDLLDRPRAKQPDWQTALKSEKPLIATNAAIALARLGNGHPESVLADGVRSTELKMATRRAAAEALGDVQSPAAIDQIRQLIDEYGQFDSEHRARYQPDLHAELLRSLGKQKQLGVDQHLFDALKSPSATVKREALTAISLQPSIEAKSLPPLALDMTTDGDSLVRVAALKLLAEKKHPQTLDKLQHALSDYELPVRLTAIELLGQAGATAAQGRLKQLATDHAELTREAAIKALVNLGDRDDVEAAATDQSWRVRRAVAASLAKYPDRRASILAQQFLGDLSLEVQLETVRTLKAWPLEKAGPLLLTALEGPTYQTRKDAASQLGDRWAAAAGFPIDAPTDRRVQLVAQLQSQWSSQFGNIDQAALAAAGQRPSEIPLARRRQVSRWIDDLANPDSTKAEQTTAIESLLAVGPELPAVLESLLSEQNTKLPSRLYADVLVHCGKEFELVNQLTNPDLTIRRAAINELGKFAQEKTISLAAIMRVQELLTAEKDPIIWIAAFKLIDHDPRRPAALLATAGLSHPAAEVRRRACGYFANYPDLEKTNALLAALSDENISVLHAAAQALGEFAPPPDPAPLENLLAFADHSVRLDAAVSLAKWNLASGTDAIERLASDDDPVVRRKTAQAIGKLGNTALLPVLIRQLDDAQDIRRAALISLKTLTGSDNPPPDAAVHPAAFDAPSDGTAQATSIVPIDPASATLLEQANRWKHWYSNQNR